MYSAHTPDFCDPFCLHLDFALKFVLVSSYQIDDHSSLLSPAIMRLSQSRRGMDFVLFVKNDIPNSVPIHT